MGKSSSPRVEDFGVVRPSGSAPGGRALLVIGTAGSRPSHKVAEAFLREPHHLLDGTAPPVEGAEGINLEEAPVAGGGRGAGYRGGR